MNLQKLFSGLKVRSLGRALGLKEKIGKADLGILKVAFMVAALDGEVTDKEYKAFDLLAKKCRGYTPKAAAQALDEAMRSAGYLMLLSPRVKESDLVKAFLAEARKALPNGFAYLSLEDVRRAVRKQHTSALRLEPDDAVPRLLVHRGRRDALELRDQPVPLVEHDHLHVPTSIVSVAGT